MGEKPVEISSSDQRMSNYFLIFIFLLISLILFAGLAGAVGIGGGGFFTPLLIIFGGIPIFTAIPLTSAIIMGVGSASTAINIKKKSINYKLALLFEPLTIVGTIIGIQIHLMATEYVIRVVFLVVMILLTLKMYQKALSFRQYSKNGEAKLSFTSDLSLNRIFLGLFGSIIAGFISALVGIGGGLIKVPMMSGLGLSPELACGTGSFMVLFTSMSTVLQFLFYQRLDIGIGILLFFLGFSASLIGTAISRFNTRPEIIQYFLTFAVVSSTLLILAQWILL